MKVAFATVNGKKLDCPFEDCLSFSVFDFSEAGYSWLESRSVAEFRGEEDEGRSVRRLQLLSDCKVLFVGRIGSDASRQAVKAGIMCFQSEPGTEVIAQLEKMQAMLRLRPPLWLTRALRQAEDQIQGE